MQMRSTRWWRGIAAGSAVVVLVYLASPPLLRAIGGQLIHSDPLEHVDVVIVLAPLLDRVLEAAEVYRAGYAPLIALTREVRPTADQILIDRGIIESGEELRRDILVAPGVPAESVVILDGVVGSTADEAGRFAEWVQTHPIRSVMVVTSPSMTGRARLTFVRTLQNFGVKVLVRASPTVPFRREDWWRSRATLRDGIIEFQKLLYYAFIELPRLTPPPRLHPTTS